MKIEYDKDFEKVMNELKANFGWSNIEVLPDSYRDLLNDTIKAVKNCSILNVNDFSFEEIVDGVDYGFKYRDESQHDGHVPIGNSLQWLMGKRKMSSLPEQWKRYLEVKRSEQFFCNNERMGVRCIKQCNGCKAMNLD